MKHFLSILLFSICASTFAQEWPWFFSETAFQKWLSDKNVKCLKYVSEDSQNSLKKRMITYYFNESGELNYVRIEKYSIAAHDGSMTQKNYYSILDSLERSLPWKMQEADKAKLSEYNQSKLFPGIRFKLMGDAIAPDGTVFSESRIIRIQNSTISFAYNYQLNQEIYLENGEISSVKNYDLRGDFYIPNMGIIQFEKLNDSISILSEKAYITFDDYAGYIGGKDTIINHPYYRKVSTDKELVEYGVRIMDSLDIYCYTPLKEIITNESAYEKVQIITQIYDHLLQLTQFFILANNGNYSYLFHENTLYKSEYWGSWLCYNKLADIFGFEKTKVISKLDKKTNEIIEKKNYSLENNEWFLLSEENKTKTGYLQNHYAVGWKKPTHQIEITIDEQNDPIFKKFANEKEEIIFRISGDSIYLTRDENFYGHFLIEYE